MENPFQIGNIITVRPSTVTGTQAPSSPLSQLQSGDTISVSVSEVSGEGVTLTLPDGSTLHASMKAGQPLQAQDTLVLQLSADHGSAPSLRLLSVNAQPVTSEIPLLDMALMEMNVPASRDNLAAAALLSKLGLPVDPQTLSRFSELKANFPSLPPEQAAVFASSNIPLDAQNVSAFEQFIRLPAQAGDVAAALESALSGDAAPISSDATSALPVQNAVAAQTPQSAVAPEAQAAETQGAQAPAQGSEPAQSSSENAKTIPEGQTPQQVPVSEQAMQQASAASRAQGSEQPAAPALLQSADEKTVADALRAVFPKLKSEESVSLGKALQKAVPALASRISALSEAAASSNAQGAKEASQLGGQFVRQLSFGGEMNSLYYTQIPFEYKDSRSNAELYVLKRDRGEDGVDPDNATIALCLDTRNMGRVESLLQVRSSELSFNFRVESRQIKSLMQDELHYLSELTYPAQYHYRGASVSLMESPITPVNAVKQLRETFGMPETAGFDVSI